MKKDAAEVAEILRTMDSFCDGRLSKRVEIGEYSNKLADKACCICAENEMGVAGVLFYYKNEIKTELYIPFICTRPETWGSGLASKMLIHLKDENRGYNSIKLEVANSNGRAIRFYEKEGFKIISEMRDSLLLELN